MNSSPAFPIGKFVTVNGGKHRIHYHESGARSADKPTLLYLHGSGPGASGYSNFRRNYPLMVEAGYHILAVDYMGYGHSDKPDDFAYTIVNQVAVIEDFLVQLGIDNVVPIGNSLGGYLGIAYTLHFPHKVPKLICMAPGGIEDVAKWVPESKGLIAMAAAVQKRNFNAENFRELLKLIVKDEAWLTEEVINERLPIAQQQPLEVYSTAVWWPIWDKLSKIKIPVLGFWGQHDQFVPVRHAHIMLEQIPDCRMIISGRAGHWFMMEDTELFNSACLQFLEETN